MSQIVDFSKLGGPVFVGRANGEHARNLFKLDELDSLTGAIEVHIPHNAYSVNSSFFLGMFGRSLTRFGSREAFLGHYRISAPDHVRRALDSTMDRALANKGKLSLS